MSPVHAIFFKPMIPAFAHGHLHAYSRCAFFSPCRPPHPPPSLADFPFPPCCLGPPPLYSIAEKKHPDILGLLLLKSLGTPPLLKSIPWISPSLMTSFSCLLFPVFKSMLLTLITTENLLAQCFLPNLPLRLPHPAPDLPTMPLLHHHPFYALYWWKLQTRTILGSCCLIPTCNMLWLLSVLCFSFLISPRHHPNSDFMPAFSFYSSEVVLKLDNHWRGAFKSPDALTQCLKRLTQKDK